jgi:thymidylate kinase
MKQKQLIIVEGPDGAGKTTLIKKTFKKQSRVFKMRHHGAYPGEEEIAQHYMKTMWPAFTGRQAIIMDRCWLAEPIYGAAFRQGQDRIGVAYARMLERVALTCRGVVVLCLPPFSVCAKAFKARLAVGKEYLDSVPTLRKVYDGYEYLHHQRVHSCALPIVKYDWRKAVTGLNGLYDYMELHRPARNMGPGAGHWAPGEVVLLVGERLSPGVRAGFPPFVSFTRAGCSAWLAEQLHTGGILERQLYWVNALGKGGRPIDPTFVAGLKPKRIIALGEVAAGWCRASGHAFDSAPHPQYWKRFKSSEPYQLINMLKEVWK